nr:TfoX/Sxy family DNA transformation protein [Pseudomonas aeruginosa]
MDQRVQAHQQSGSKVLLYAIEGALLDVHWNELSPDHKAALLGELETFPVRNKS